MRAKRPKPRGRHVLTEAKVRRKVCACAHVCTCLVLCGCACTCVLLVVYCWRMCSLTLECVLLREFVRFDIVGSFLTRVLTPSHLQLSPPVPKSRFCWHSVSNSGLADNEDTSTKLPEYWYIAYIHACMHACTHTYIHAYIHTYIHACMHVYKHSNA